VWSFSKKKTNCWEVPYWCTKPEGYSVVSGPRPLEHNKLDKSFANSVKRLPEYDFECSGDEMDEEDFSDDMNEDFINNDNDLVTGLEQEDSKDKSWMITNNENGVSKLIHIKRAIKILLPCEKISRSRQKRHLASKYLPGKEPLNPSHDMFS